MAKYFLSHSSIHKTFCTSLKTELEHAGHTVWLDSFDLHAGTAVPTSIVDGIYGSDFFLLLMTPEIHTSKWVNWELEVATCREVEGSPGFILPIMYVQTAQPRLVAHKLYVSNVATPSDTVNEILKGKNSKSIDQVAGKHSISISIKPDRVGSISQRQIKDILFDSYCSVHGVYSYFPGFTKATLVTVASDRSVMTFDESNTNERRLSITEWFDGGEIKVQETYSAEMNGDTIVSPKNVISKIARIVDIANTIYQLDDDIAKFEVSVEVSGLWNGFVLDGLVGLDYDPPNFVGVGGPKTLAHGTKLHRKKKFQVGANNQTIADDIYDLQLDLFYPIQCKSLIGAGFTQMKFNKAASDRIVMQMLTQGLLD